jgi:DNA-binding sugar fermentation-stimulating protein|tara:strand:- start:392 stop:604 length:213 start_codon:yes stop_codon:yes gene_type:complete
MKVNRTYKIIRPMRKFGNLIKDIFYPQKSNHFWIRVKEVAKNKKEKEEQMFAIIELLNNRIEINGQDTEY